MCVCCIGFPGVFLAVKRDGMKEKRERERGEMIVIAVY